ncbi:hypothetical protein GN278_17360 [Rhodobacteraceae bacterium Araon29]
MIIRQTLFQVNSFCKTNPWTVLCLFVSYLVLEGVSFIFDNHVATFFDIFGYLAIFSVTVTLFAADMKLFEPSIKFTAAKKHFWATVIVFFIVVLVVVFFFFIFVGALIFLNIDVENLVISPWFFACLSFFMTWLLLRLSIYVPLSHLPAETRPTLVKSYISSRRINRDIFLVAFIEALVCLQMIFDSPSLFFEAMVTALYSVISIFSAGFIVTAGKKLYTEV